MTNLFLMDWNAKTPLQWDWDALLNGKAVEIPKKLRPTEWGFEGEEGIDTGSLYSSGGGGGSGSGSGGTVSDVGRLSSSKSSKSASVDSSSIGKTSKSPFQELDGLHGDFHSKKELDKANSTGTSLTLETAVDSGEPLIGLKLGKRTYFEDFCAGSSAKSSSFSVTPMSSAPTAKRSRSSYQNTVATRCQVEGCNLDISSAKDYHRKHKICESHSKCPKVIVNGLERRFCQQCSRFHGLEEFDEKKRSCRKRLSDHNARRRKPRQETIQFGSVRMSSALYDGRQQMGMELNQFPFVHARNPTWQSKSNSIFTLTKECTLRPARTRGVDGQLHLPRNEPPNSVSTLYHDSKWLLPLKGGTSEGLNGGLEESMISTNLDATQDLRRALSLLSTNSWGSCQPVSVNDPMHVTNSTATNPVMHPVSEDLPLVASENWWTEQPSSDYQVHAFNSQSSGSTNFPEFQLFKGPYGSGSYSSQLN